MTPTSLRWTVVNLGGQKATLLKTVLGAATCVLGFLGFAEIYRPATPEAYVECLFRTVQLLFAQFPPDVRAAAGDDIPWTLNVARFAMPALFLWFGATALVRKIRRPIGAASVGMKRGHLILTGAADHTAALMRRRKGEPAEDGVILAGDEAEAATLSAGRGAVLVGDSADPETWRRAGVLRARAALILESDDRAGMAAALAVAEAARDRSTDMEPIDVVCALADPDLRALVDQVYSGQDVLPGVALHIASPAEASVRELLAREPLHRSVDVERGEPVRAGILAGDHRLSGGRSGPGRRGRDRPPAGRPSRRVQHRLRLPVRRSDQRADGGGAAARLGPTGPSGPTDPFAAARPA